MLLIPPGLPEHAGVAQNSWQRKLCFVGTSCTGQVTVILCLLLRVHLGANSQVSAALELWLLPAVVLSRCWPWTQMSPAVSSGSLLAPVHLKKKRVPTRGVDASVRSILRMSEHAGVAQNSWQCKLCFVGTSCTGQLPVLVIVYLLCRAAFVYRRMSQHSAVSSAQSMMQ